MKILRFIFENFLHFGVILKVALIWSPVAEHFPTSQLELRRCFIILIHLKNEKPRCQNASDKGEIVECSHRYDMCYKEAKSMILFI